MERTYAVVSPTKQTTIRIQEELAAPMERDADRLGMTVSAWMREAFWIRLALSAGLRDDGDMVEAIRRVWPEGPKI